jgi:hypothetical protein
VLHSDVAKKQPQPLPEFGCHNCRFWRKDDDGGTCRRDPPTVVYDTEDGAFSIWPMTAAEDWCGEHTVKLNG